MMDDFKHQYQKYNSVHKIRARCENIKKMRKKNVVKTNLPRATKSHNFPVSLKIDV